MNQIIGLGRPLDFSYRTNLWIAILSGAAVAAAFIFQLISRVPLGQSALFGLGAGAACFLGWALTRELDPDHPITAFPAALASAAAVFFFGLPGFLQLFLFLFLLRGITAITGREMQIGDAFIITGLSIWLVLRGHWLYGAITAVALITASIVSHRKWVLIPAGTAFLLIPVPFLLRKALHFGPALTLPVIITVTIVTILFTLHIILLKRTNSRTDDGKLPLHIGRYKAAAVVVLIAALAETLLYGSRGLVLLLPLWAAFFFVPVLSRVSSLFIAESGTQ